MQNLADMLIGLFVLASLWGWIFVLRRVLSGRPLIVPVQAPPVPWTLGDIAVTVMILLCLQERSSGWWVPGAASSSARTCWR